MTPNRGPGPDLILCMCRRSSIWHVCLHEFVLMAISCVSACVYELQRCESGADCRQVKRNSLLGHIGTGAVMIGRRELGCV